MCQTLFSEGGSISVQLSPFVTHVSGHFHTVQPVSRTQQRHQERPVTTTSLEIMSSWTHLFSLSLPFSTSNGANLTLYEFIACRAQYWCYSFPSLAGDIVFLRDKPERIFNVLTFPLSLFIITSSSVISVKIFLSV